MDGVILQDGNLDLLNFAVLMGSASVLMPHCNIISRLCVSQIADVTARVLTEVVIGHKFQLIKLCGVLAAFFIISILERKISTHQFIFMIYQVKNIKLYEVSFKLEIIT